MRILNFFRTEEGPEPKADQKLQGSIDASWEHGSAWIDLSSLADFKKGDRLKLTLGGSAVKILIRFLPQGGKPDRPIGIASGGPFEIPDSRILILTLAEDHQRVEQISVHGNPKPWGISLGETNGPVTLLSVERLATEKLMEPSVG